MSLNLTIVPKGFAEADKALQGIKGAFPKVISESINYGLRSGSTMAAKSVTARYNIASAAIKGEGLKVQKANHSNLSGFLKARGPMLPVSLFKPKVTRLKKLGGRQRVTAAIIRKQGKVIKGAFAILGNKIFERRQPDRLPIWPVMTIGIPYMLRYMGIVKKVQDTIINKTEERLAHRVSFMLSKAGAK